MVIKVESLCGTPPLNKNFNTEDASKNQNRRRRNTEEEEQAAKKSLQSLKVSSSEMLNPAAEFTKKTADIIKSLKNDRGIESLQMPFGVQGPKSEYEK